MAGSGHKLGRDWNMVDEEKRLLEKVRGMYGSTGRSPRGLTLRLQPTPAGQEGYLMEVAINDDVVLGKELGRTRERAGIGALHQAVYTVREEIMARQAPKSSSTMLHGITVVDKKNMTKNEEEMMRQLVEACSAAGYPQPSLRAKSHAPGKEGWTMEVASGDRIIGEGRNPRRGAAGEAALAAALQTVTGRAAIGFAPGSGTRRAGGNAVGATKEGGGGGGGGGSGRSTVVTKNNMSTHEKDLMDQLLLLAKGRGFTEAPQLRATKAPRGEENWTMEVVAGLVTLSTAKGKRRSFAGKVALHRAIDALVAHSAAGGPGAAAAGAPLAARPPTVDEHAVVAGEGAAAAASAPAAVAAVATASPSEAAKPPTNFAAAVGQPAAAGTAGTAAGGAPPAVPPPAAAAAAQLHGFEPEDEALLKQLREVCGEAGVLRHPLIRSRKQVVWSRVSWTVEVLVGGSTDADDQSQWLKEESTAETHVAALRAALGKAITSAKAKGAEVAAGGVIESLPLAATGIKRDNVVLQKNLTVTSDTYMRRLEAVCKAASIHTTPLLRNNPKLKREDAFHMEVISGDRVLGCGQHKVWQVAGEIALKHAIERVTAIYKARNGGSFDSSGARLAQRGTLHGITIVEAKNMTKGEEELVRKLRARCGVDDPQYAGPTPVLRAKCHQPELDGWTMEVAFGDKVIGEGRHMRRGAAGEAALSVAIDNVLKGRAKVTRPAAKPARDEVGWEVLFAPTDQETAALKAVADGWAEGKGKGSKDGIRLVATAFHADGSWTMEVRVGDKPAGRFRHADRAQAGVSALREAARQLLGAAFAATIAPPPAPPPPPPVAAQPEAQAPAAVEPPATTPPSAAPAQSPGAPPNAPAPAATAAAPPNAPTGGDAPASTDDQGPGSNGEVLMRQIAAMATTAGVALPHLQEAQLEGGGWSMDVIVDSGAVIAKAQDASRSVAIEQALTAAVATFPRYIAEVQKQAQQRQQAQAPPQQQYEAQQAPSQTSTQGEGSAGPPGHAGDGPSGEARPAESRADKQRWIMLQELCSRLHADGLASLKPKISQLDYTQEFVAEIRLGAILIGQGQDKDKDFAFNHAVNHAISTFRQERNVATLQAALTRMAALREAQANVPQPMADPRIDASTMAQRMPSSRVLPAQTAQAQAQAQASQHDQALPPAAAPVGRPASIGVNGSGGGAGGGGGGSAGGEYDPGRSRSFPSSWGDLDGGRGVPAADGDSGRSRSNGAVHGAGDPTVAAFTSGAVAWGPAGSSQPGSQPPFGWSSSQGPNGEAVFGAAPQATPPIGAAPSTAWSVGGSGGATPWGSHPRHTDSVNERSMAAPPSSTSGPGFREPVPAATSTFSGGWGGMSAEGPPRPGPGFGPAAMGMGSAEAPRSHDQLQHLLQKQLRHGGEGMGHHHMPPPDMQQQMMYSQQRGAVPWGGVSNGHMTGDAQWGAGDYGGVPQGDYYGMQGGAGAGGGYGDSDFSSGTGIGGGGDWGSSALQTGGAKAPGPPASSSWSAVPAFESKGHDDSGAAASWGAQPPGAAAWSTAGDEKHTPAQSPWAMAGGRPAW